MFVAFAAGERSTGLALGRADDIPGLVGTALMAPAVIEIHRATYLGQSWWAWHRARVSVDLAASPATVAPATSSDPARGRAFEDR